MTHLQVSLHAARDISFSMRISWPYCLCPFPNARVHSCQCDGVKRLGQQDRIKLWRLSPSEWAQRLCPRGLIQQQGAVVPVESSPQQTPVPEPWSWSPMFLELNSSLTHQPVSSILVQQCRGTKAMATQLAEHHLLRGLLSLMSYQETFVG